MVIQRMGIDIQDLQVMQVMQVLMLKRWKRPDALNGWS